MAKKRALIARRTEQVGIGELTFNLVAGEPVPDLPDEVLQTLVDNQQAFDSEAKPGFDEHSQEYRDLQTVEDAEEDAGKK